MLPRNADPRFECRVFLQFEDKRAQLDSLRSRAKDQRNSLHVGHNKRKGSAVRGMMLLTFWASFRLAAGRLRPCRLHRTEFRGPALTSIPATRSHRSPESRLVCLPDNVVPDSTLPRGNGPGRPQACRSRLWREWHFRSTMADPYDVFPAERQEDAEHERRDSGQHALSGRAPAHRAVPGPPPDRAPGSWACSWPLPSWPSRTAHQEVVQHLLGLGLTTQDVVDLAELGLDFLEPVLQEDSLAGGLAGRELLVPLVQLLDIGIGNGGRRGSGLDPGQ